MPEIKLEVDDELYEALAETAITDSVSVEELVEAILEDAMFEDEENDTVPEAEAVEEGIVVDDEDEEAKLDEGEEV